MTDNSMSVGCPFRSCSGKLFELPSQILQNHQNYIAVDDDYQYLHTKIPVYVTHTPSRHIPRTPQPSDEHSSNFNTNLNSPFRVTPPSPAARLVNKTRAS